MMFLQVKDLAWVSAVLRFRCTTQSFLAKDVLTTWAQLGRDRAKFLTRNMYKL